PSPIEPGPHTLTIVLSRANRREYTFHVRPNEHVVILASARRPGAPDAPDAPGAPDDQETP
ncbi:MAG TPA: hypothetical protein VLS89_14520, partial [Candidatus Nanopelagicales bacterium]|nr:hypothetical protein [Candidatus Nanopelagicales bacterium]